MVYHNLGHEQSGLVDLQVSALDSSSKDHCSNPDQSVIFSAFYATAMIVRWGPGRVAQSVGHLTHKSRVLGSIHGLVTYFRFSFRFFKKGSCQLLAKVCARSTG